MEDVSDTCQWVLRGGRIPRSFKAGASSRKVVLPDDRPKLARSLLGRFLDCEDLRGLPLIEGKARLQKLLQNDKTGRLDVLRASNITTATHEEATARSDRLFKLAKSDPRGI
jgi:hypothetical protein